MKTLIRVLIALIVVVVGVFFLLGYILYPNKYIDIAKKSAEEYDVSPYLVMAVIKAESGFDSTVVSNKGAQGLMQIMPETAQWCTDMMGITKADLFEPEHNIKMGTWYLHYLIERFGGRVDVALAAYNAGPGKVAEWLENDEYSHDGVELNKIPYPETERYVQNVLKYYEKYEEMY